MFESSSGARDPVKAVALCAQDPCDAVPDGCGGALTCATCESGQTCGVTGAKNVCAVAPKGSNALDAI